MAWNAHSPRHLGLGMLDCTVPFLAGGTTANWPPSAKLYVWCKPTPPVNALPSATLDTCKVRPRRLWRGSGTSRGRPANTGHPPPTTPVAAATIAGQPTGKPESDGRPAPRPGSPNGAGTCPTASPTPTPTTAAGARPVPTPTPDVWPSNGTGPGRKPPRGCGPCRTAPGPGTGTTAAAATGASRPPKPYASPADGWYLPRPAQPDSPSGRRLGPRR